MWNHMNKLFIKQNSVTKLVVTLSYKLTQYLFTKSEFWQIHYWITTSSYILHAYKISRKLKINSYVINKLQVFIISFCNLKLYIKYKLIDHMVNNIWLTQNLTCVLRA